MSLFGHWMPEEENIAEELLPDLQLAFPEIEKFDLAALVHRPGIKYIGSNATVISAYEPRRERNVVLKSFLNESREDLGEFALHDFFNEVTVLTALGSASAKSSTETSAFPVVHIYGYGVFARKLTLVMEPLIGSMRDLLDLISDTRRTGQISSFKPTEKLYYWILWGEQMAKSLYFIHSHGIVHRDIKPEHFMFRGFNRLNTLILINFTSSRIFSDEFDLKKSSRFISSYEEHESNSNYSVVGTHPYVAPETFGNQSITEKADIWALGFILLELFGGYEAISTYTSSRQGSIVQWCRDRQAPTVPSSLCDEILDEMKRWMDCKVWSHTLNSQCLQKWSTLQISIKRRIFTLVNECLSIDPASRPSAKMIVECFSNLLEEVSLFTAEC
ncbi:hypothetical protein IE077_000757 [Cardiosporidium cionae]|uniref:Protein kinase domain-containing protein n=1 Tax=Cardiosporidium cionae TaxID=476202 RepID=A0ABQ7J6J1_9APIC|nr:hypothetical protein IE077_000757 [Cardiosporidium cionae]|eukprot:KAF8819617.1 hypothetical protein IE077_000757 [Cardiosporidium cionae]